MQPPLPIECCGSKRLLLQLSTWNEPWKWSNHLHRSSFCATYWWLVAIPILSALQPKWLLVTVGSCIAAGYNSSCCLSGSCLGDSSSRSRAYCHCDANCRLFEDCCSDITRDCQKQGMIHHSSWWSIVIHPLIVSELTEYIMVANQNFIHRIDINSALSRYRLQTPLSNLKNAYHLDYHYR